MDRPTHVAEVKASYGYGQPFTCDSDEDAHHEAYYHFMECAGDDSNKSLEITPFDEWRHTMPQVDLRLSGGNVFGVRVGGSHEGYLEFDGGHWVLKGHLAEVIGDCRSSQIGAAIFEMEDRLAEGFKDKAIVRTVEPWTIQRVVGGGGLVRSEELDGHDQGFNVGLTRIARLLGSQEDSV